jgi:hypothetical protein
MHYQIIPGTYVTLESPLGCVKVEGRSIDAIRLCIESELPWGYRKITNWPFPPPGTSMERVTYNISYIVYGLVETLENELEAETRPIKEGLLEKKVTGFEWQGGRLAGILNADSDLKDVLLKMGPPDIAVEPHREKTPLSTDTQLILKPEASDEMQSKEKQYVEITASIIVADEKTAKGQAFPSSEAFEAYDRIARHIRSIITYSPSLESDQSLQPPTTSPQQPSSFIEYCPY